MHRAPHDFRSQPQPGFVPTTTPTQPPTNPFDPNSPRTFNLTVNTGIPFPSLYPSNDPNSALTTSFNAAPSPYLNASGVPGLVAPVPVAPGIVPPGLAPPGSPVVYNTDPNANPNADPSTNIVYDPAQTYLIRKANEDVDMMSQKSDTTEILKQIQQDIQAHREQDAKDMTTLNGSMSTMTGNMTTMMGNITTMMENMTTMMGNMTTMMETMTNMMQTMTTMTQTMTSIKDEIIAMSCVMQNVMGGHAVGGGFSG